VTAAGVEEQPVGGLVEWWLWQAPSVARMSVESLTAEQKALELQRVQARKAMDCAYEAELVMALAAERPDADDPPPGHPGARRSGAGSPVEGVSEFFPDELALVLNCGRPFAAGVLADAFQLVERMPAVLAACRAGALDWFRARVFADVLGHASDEVVAVVVPAVLPQAAGLSSGKLRNRLISAAEAADEEFAEQRRQEAARRAAVRLRPTADGMSALTTEAPAAVAAAMWSVIDQAAQLARTGGDDRSIDLLRAEAHAAKVLGTQSDGPAMTGHVTISAPLSALGGAAPREGVGETVERAAAGAATPTVAGVPITAAHLRELLAQLDALGVQAPAGDSLTLAITDDDGALLATTTRTELARLAARGCRAHGPAAECDCPALGPPPDVDGYQHTAAQERFPYDCGGRTSRHNLCCLCRTHHRLKTFARGWRFEMHPDGTLTVTTPSGITRTTRPPGLREQRALPPPEPAPAPAPADETPPPF
jgi:hypothetical protein